MDFFFQKREIFQDLAPLLWHSYGTIAALLQVGYNSSCCLSQCGWVRMLVLPKRNSFESFMVFSFSLFVVWIMQEIVSIYPSLSPPTLSPGASNRVCNALALLQVHLYMRKKETLRQWEISTYDTGASWWDERRLFFQHVAMHKRGIDKMLLPLSPNIRDFAYVIT
jgi:hypothetical protein